ncbi:unnamed protein product [Caenorhabditis nigoni]
MIHIDIIYFFKEILKITTIDNLWFDEEGEEFGNDFFDVYYQNGRFDRNKIDINITSDVPIRKREFMKFLKRIIQEKRYGVYFGDAYGLRRRRLLLAGTWSDFGKDIVGSRPRSDKLPASFRPLNSQCLQIPARIRPLSVPFP